MGAVDQYAELAAIRQAPNNGLGLVLIGTMLTTVDGSGDVFKQHSRVDRVIEGVLCRNGGIIKNPNWVKADEARLRRSHRFTCINSLTRPVY